MAIELALKAKWLGLTSFVKHIRTMIKVLREQKPTNRGIHPPEANDAYCIFPPILAKFKNPHLRSFSNFLLPPYFDHDAFTHHVLDAPATKKELLCFDYKFI